MSDEENGEMEIDETKSSEKKMDIAEDKKFPRGNPAAGPATKPFVDMEKNAYCM